MGEVSVILGFPALVAALKIDINGSQGPLLKMILRICLHIRRKSQYRYETPTFIAAQWN